MQNKLIDFFDSHAIKGFLQHEEGLALYRYALKVRIVGACLEIGSYCGKSTVYLGLACKESENTLFAVDHHGGSEEHQIGEEYYDQDLFDQTTQRINSFPWFQRTIELADLQCSVIPIVTSSQTLALVWQQPLGLVFIDGGHSEQQAMHDVLAWAKHVANGGYLAIHDIYATPEEGGQAPRLAMEKLLQQQAADWQMVEQVGSLVFLKKLHSSELG